MLTYTPVRAGSWIGALIAETLDVRGLHKSKTSSPASATFRESRKSSKSRTTGVEARELRGRDCCRGLPRRRGGLVIHLTRALMQRLQESPFSLVLLRSQRSFCPRHRSQANLRDCSSVERVSSTSRLLFIFSADSLLRVPINFGHD